MKPSNASMDEFVRMQTLLYWLDTEMGQDVFALAKKKTKALLGANSGLVLQLGGASLFDRPCADSCHYLLATPVQDKHKVSAQVVASMSALPFSDDSFDVIVCPHTHEMQDPGELGAWLEGVYRLLKPYGRLVLFGIRAYSLWWLHHQMTSSTLVFPWMQRAYPCYGLKKMLEVTGFSVKQSATFCFYPYRQAKPGNISFLVDRMGEMLVPQWGGVYCMVAQKEQVPMILDRTVLKRKPLFKAPQAIQTRNY
jgi:SAM-dependent methyltransferase